MFAPPAFAQSSLTEFSGHWSGRGSDRDLPFHALQPTLCRMTVKADGRHLNTETECNGAAGLHKRIRFSATSTGNTFNGRVEQSSSVRGSGQPAKRRAGKLTGTRAGDTAEFEISFPGLTPNAYVVLSLTSQNSFSMRTSVLGVALMDVEFHRGLATTRSNATR